jgi:hypothetical protein
MLELLLLSVAAVPRLPVRGELPPSCLLLLLDLPSDDDHDNCASCLHFAVESGHLRTLQVLLG